MANTVGILVFSYLLGSFPSGFIAGKLLANIDIRELGSGSTGATNVLRNIGKRAALVVFLFDVIKGTLAVVLSRYLGFQDFIQVIAGLFAITGHIWPIWLKGKGGKAVATGFGMFLGLAWPVGLASLGIFLTVISLSKIVSLASISAAISLPILMNIYYLNHAISYSHISITVIAMILVIWRHRSNISRILNGTEPKLSK